MPQVARQALATLLIALHAVIAICGPGLHAGLGSGHVGSSHCAGPAKGSPEATQLAASPADHCPICDHFAQGQLPGSSGILSLARFDAPFEPAGHRVEAPRPPPLSARSRAPPRASA